ncbi:MAG: PQQ-dependent sugar dehydrogenase [Deltaproteobacteria bacterium]|nr:PQQ-dependent sugar dehydrogenase [Deltaproteobacteria bacterium]
MSGARLQCAFGALLAAWLLTGGAARAQPSAERYPLQTIRLPAGFRINLFAGGAVNPRQMALGAKGTLFVGTLRAGAVYAVVDRDRDGVADDGMVLLSGLVAPNGVAVREGALYVADAWRILRYDDIERDLEHPPKPVVVYEGYPHDAHHGWKFIGFGPDGFLYVPVGAPCNVCERDPPYASITRLKPDGTGLEVFARGVRNSVGFDWDPNTRELWFTDNGRDRLGDDLPSDELNHAPKAGMHFGFPYCHAKGLADPQFGKGQDCSEYTPGEIDLGPHVAALGMRFYTGETFPEEYRGQIFIAEHGSWDRSKPIGYRLAVARPAETGARRLETFAEGWLGPNGKAWGRPVDLLVAPDGALLVSDDTAGAIYRITYGGK